MTEKLKNLMHERADQTTFAVPDLALVRAAGARRRRRQYAGVTGAGLVAVVAVGALFLTLTDTPSDDAGPDIASEPPSSGVPSGTTWSIGSVINNGDGPIEVGHQVVSYVPTDVGFVTTDPDGAVWSVHDGEVEQVGRIGTTDDENLAADPGDSRVAWIDADGPQVVVLDQQTGEKQTYLDPLAAEGPDEELSPGQVYALSDGVLYARSGAEAVAVDLDSGDVRVVHPEVTGADRVIDAAAGVVAFAAADGEGTQIAVGPTRAEAGPAFEGQLGDGSLSPDAAYLAFSDDEGTVVDTATGQPVELDVTGFYEVYGWTDGHTASLIAENDSGGARLVTCDVRDGSCTDVVPDLGSFDDLDAGFSLPVGSH